MTSIRFEPVTEHNLSAFIHITRETLWQPVWPGDEAVVRDFHRWPHELQRAALLIFDGRELVGRVVAPQFDDYAIVRDLGLRAQPERSEQVAHALLRRTAQQQASTMRVIVLEPWWPAFAKLGSAEQKRRVTMRLDLSRAMSAPEQREVRTVSRADVDAMGELMYAAYHGTVDDEGEDGEQWASHTRDLIEGLYGKFLHLASFVTPVSSPFHSATLLIENAPRSAVLAQAITHRSQTNRGHARFLISHSLAALVALAYEHCFLEVTLTNANAIHLYHSLGFVETGPQIIYGIRMLSS